MTATPTPLVVVCGSVSDPARLHAAAQPWILAGWRVHVPAANPLLSNDQHDADHRRWLDSADGVIVVRKPDGTIGESTGGERLYAVERGFWEVWYWPEGGQVPEPERVATPGRDHLAVIKRRARAPMLDIRGLEDHVATLRVDRDWLISEVERLRHALTEGDR